MDRIPLPGSDLSVAPLALGVAGFGTGVDRQRAVQLLEAFLAAGGDLVDTAHCYAFWLPGGLGQSERVLGQAIRDLGARERLVVATKGGHPDGGPDYPRPDAYLAPEIILSDLRESLQRLEMDSVDLYYLHRDDARVPVDEVMDCLGGCVRAGQVRALGASNWSIERIAEANEWAARNGAAGFCCSQVQWSLATPNREAGPDPTVRYVTPADEAWHARSGLPIIAYSATGNGCFAYGAEMPGDLATEANEARRERARSLARSLGRTPTQVALVWLLARRPAVVPLFSTSRPERIAEAFGATEVRLTERQARWLESGE